MTRHIKSVHEGKKSFSCNDCEKKFSEKSDLDKHICKTSPDINDFLKSPRVHEEIESLKSDNKISLASPLRNLDLNPENLLTPKSKIPKKSSLILLRWQISKG